MLRPDGAAPAAVPFSIRWQDPARGLSIDFQFRTIRRLQDLVDGMAGCGIGVLLGSAAVGAADILIVDVCMIANDEQSARLPLSETLAQTISTHTSGAERRMYPVGLFIAGSPRTSPTGADLARVARAFKGIVPLFVIEKQPSGPALARLSLWSPVLAVVEKADLAFPIDWRVLAQRGYHPFVANYQGGHASVRSLPAAPEPAPAALPQEWSPPVVGRPQQDVRPVEHTRPDSSVLRVPKWAVASGAAAALTAATMWVLMSPQSDRFVRATAIKEAQPSATSDLGLEVSRSGTDLQVKWNRTSPDILSAQFGFLRVLEGGNRIEIALDAEQLRSGRILYTPRAPTLDLVLDVTTRSGKAQETVRVIQSPGSGTTQSNGSISTDGSLSKLGNTNVGAREATSRSRDSEPASSPKTDPEQELPPVRKIFALPPAPSTKSTPSIDVAAPPPAISYMAQSAPAVPSAQNQVIVAPPRPAAPVPSQPSVESAPPKTGVRTPPILKSDIFVDLPSQTRMLMRGPVTVEVKLTVDERGRVTDVQPLNATGISSYVARSLSQRARYWHFDPATLDGKPIAAEHVLKLIVKN